MLPTKAAETIMDAINAVAAARRHLTCACCRREIDTGKATVETPTIKLNEKEVKI
jgi:hypothetical protein